MCNQNTKVYTLSGSVSKETMPSFDSIGTDFPSQRIASQLDLMRQTPPTVDFIVTAVGLKFSHFASITNPCHAQSHVNAPFLHASGAAGRSSI